MRRVVRIVSDADQLNRLRHEVMKEAADEDDDDADEVVDLLFHMTVRSVGCVL